jgi:hypothetical protein
VRLLFFALFSLIALGLIAAVPVSALVFLVSPDACVDRSVPVSLAESESVQEIIERVRAGDIPDQVTLTESELTSRLADVLAENDVGVDNVQVYLCPQGYAEVTGNVARYGVNVDVLVRGDVEVAGDELLVRVLDTEVGGLPGGLSGKVANGIVEEVMRDNGFYAIDLDVELSSVQIGDGYVTLTRQQ